MPSHLASPEIVRIIVPFAQKRENERTSSSFSSSLCPPGCAKENVNCTGVQESKDNTGGCTAEACSFRDSYEVFKEAGAEVIGVSSDTVESHDDFAKQHHLPFILLSDQDGALRKRYGVPKMLGLLPGRVTYVIDKQGTVRHIFSSGSPLPHIQEALTILQSLP